MDILALIIAVIALMLVSGARNRIARLERNNLSTARAGDQEQVAHDQGVPAVPSVVQPVVAVQPQSALVSPPPDASSQLWAWMKEDWLLKLGALLLLIGFGWLAAYAFLNNWIGPMGRITIGIVAGALIMVLGWWRMHRFVHQGAVFMVVGSTVVLLTVFAARVLYNFFDPVTALIVMFFCTALVSYVSVLFRRKPLAIASLVLAAIAPMLTGSLNVFMLSQFTYLFVVVLATIWIVRVTGWRVLNTAALAIVTLYSLPTFMTTWLVSNGEMAFFLVIAFAFATIFFLSNIAGIIHNRERDDSADVVTALWNGLLLLGWIVAAAPKEWQSLIVIAWAIVFLVAAYIISQRTRRLEAFASYVAVGIVMIATATALELEGAVLTIAFIIEATVLTLTVHFLTRDMHHVRRAAMTFVVPVVLSLPSFIAPSWNDGVVHADLFVLLILGIALLSLGSYFAEKETEVVAEQKTTLATIFVVIGCVYLLALVWLVLHALLLADMATMIALLVYTMFGLTLYVSGIQRGLSRLVYFGGCVLGLVVLRLVTIDVWKLEIAGRIITFFVIGVLLMSTAFFGRKRSKTLPPVVNQ